MTTDAAVPAVELRTPLPLRVAAGGVMIAGLVVLGSWILRDIRNGQPGPIVASLVFTLLWLIIGWRSSSAAVIGLADGRLIVRNQFRTRTFERHQIEDVRPSSGGPFSQTQGALQLLLTDGSVLMLQATVSPPFFGRRSQRQLEELRSWLAQTS